MRLDLLLAAIRVPLDYLMLVLAGLTAWSLRFSESIVDIRAVRFALTYEAYVQIVLSVAAMWIVMFALVGLYTIGRNKKFSEELKKVFVGCTAGLAIVAIISFFSQELFHSRFLAMAGFVFAILYVLIARLILRALRVWLHRAGIGSRRVLIIGNSDTAQSMSDTLANTPGYGYHIIKQIDAFSKTTEKSLASLLRKRGIDEVMLLQRVDETQADQLLAFCTKHHLTLKFAPDVFGTYQRHTGIDTIAGTPIIELKRTRLEGWGRIIKRMSDIILATLFLLITLPLFIIASIVILLETGRPIIFKNKRVGEFGKTFFTYKFRSMFQKDSIGVQFTNQKQARAKEKELIKKQSDKKGPVYKIKDDPRVTPFGRFVRRWSVDELPQFINVIKGDMSLVGPRPHQPREVEQYELHHRKVHMIKPGITGLAQISGRSDLSFEEENRLDIFYIENWSLLMDIAVLIKTPWAVVRRRNVE